MTTPYKKALENGDKYYFTGKPCKYGHIAKRDTASGHCVTCELNRSQNRSTEFVKLYQLNRENILDNKKQNRLENREKYNNRQREYRAKNPEKVKKYSVLSKKYQKRYYLDNYYKFIANIAKRRAAKLKRTPIWLSESDKRELRLIYKIAARVSKETGIKYHVDHEIPLQGEFVSGLHVPDNLQLLKASENLSKGNRFAIN